jgi:hypothetical protein
MCTEPKKWALRASGRHVVIYVIRRADAWAEIQLNVFTSAKVGEFIKLTCRAGFSRGLHYRVSALSSQYRLLEKRCWLSFIEENVTFIIFCIEHGKVDFAMHRSCVNAGPYHGPWRLFSFNSALKGSQPCLNLLRKHDEKVYLAALKTVERKGPMRSSEERDNHVLYCTDVLWKYHDSEEVEASVLAFPV